MKRDPVPEGSVDDFVRRFMCGFGVYILSGLRCHILLCFTFSHVSLCCIGVFCELSLLCGGFNVSIYVLLVKSHTFVISYQRLSYLCEGSLFSLFLFLDISFCLLHWFPCHLPSVFGFMFCFLGTLPCGIFSY